MKNKPPKKNIRPCAVAVQYPERRTVSFVLYFPLLATLQIKTNIMFLPQSVDGSFVALKKPSPFSFPSLLLSDLVRFKVCYLFLLPEGFSNELV